MTYTQTCKQHIIDTIADWQDQDIEVSEFGHTLSEGENANGSWYCSTYKAEQDLDAFGRDAVAEFIDEYKSNFGELPYDAYTEPESFHCLMMIVGVENVFNQLAAVQNIWDKKVKLTKKLIKKIIDELKQLPDLQRVSLQPARVQQVTFRK